MPIAECVKCGGAAELVRPVTHSLKENGPTTVAPKALPEGWTRGDRGALCAKCSPASKVEEPAADEKKHRGSSRR